MTDNRDGTLVNAHFARVSESPTLPANMQRAEFQDQKPLCDPSGQLYVVATSSTPGFSSLLSQALSGGSFVSQAAIASGGIQNFAFAGWNSDPSNLLYVQMHDKAGAIVAGNVPDIIIPVPSLGAFSYSLPIIFTLGLGVAISTTPLTYTAPASPFLSYSILYRIPA